MQANAKKSVIALLGVGHTHAHIVRMWKMHPAADAELICISDRPIATYSGMLPGVLSGQYAPQQMEIDLVRLCHSAGCRLIIDQAQTIDRERKRIGFRGSRTIDYDVLSIGIGSRPAIGAVDISAEAPIEMIKPMQTFLQRLSQRLQSLNGQTPRQINIVIVGGGVGGLEVGFCLRTRLAKLFPQVEATVTIVTGGELGGGTARATRRLLRKALAGRQVKFVEGQLVQKVERDAVVLDNDVRIAADLVLWATAAIAPPLLAKIDVERDERGFLAIRPTLQSVTDDSIFAVGDSGTIVKHPSPKAGVYAVRQGPILWENLHRRLSGRRLLQYTPQRNFLKLINTGDGRAIGEYWGRANRSTWMWRIKNRIDVRFMRMYQTYRPMVDLLPSPSSNAAMRCLGCGGKIGAASLQAALSELNQLKTPNVVIGLKAPDDAAVIDCPERQITATVDFFAAPIDDPYLMGKISANHAVSDCFAMGAAPTAALAMVQIPIGHPRGQQRILRELLAGATDVFNPLGTAIVGGHTIEGPQTILGFTVLARQIVAPILKAGLKPGDRLILSKPLGSGILLAAQMRSRCKGIWYESLCERMLQGNEFMLEIAKRYTIRSATDVTGFGLAGHLLEMLDASGMRATIDLNRIPALPGSLELISEGIESTLAPDNQVNQARLGIQAKSWDRAKFQLLFDPQTSGGMLIGVPARDVSDILRELRAAGHDGAQEIGQVIPMESDGDRRQSILVTTN